MTKFTESSIEKVHWNIHTKCNVPCGFCYLKRESATDLSFTDAAKFVQSIAKWTKCIVFTGGDPLMRTDLAELVELAKNCGCSVELHTNAKLIAKWAPTRLFNFVDELGLSLDGESAEVHDKSRGAKGNFSSNLMALEISSVHNIPTTVRTTITKQNIDGLNGIAPLLTQYNAVHTWCIRQFVPLERGALADHLYSLDFSKFREEANRLQAAAQSLNPSFQALVVGRQDLSCYYFVSSDGTFFTRASDGNSYVSVGRYPDSSVDALMQVLNKRMNGEHRRRRILSDPI